MLEKLLNEIREGGSLQPATLAARLNISLGLVEMMLEDLQRRGLLTQVNASCSEPCGGCPMVGECATNSPQGRLWMLARQNDRA
jgi:Mn-dependent DtxR family transcriptional regulator